MDFAGLTPCESRWAAHCSCRPTQDKGRSPMRTHVLALVATAALGACDAAEPETYRLESATINDQGAVARGRDIWFKNTYNAEKFWTIVAGPPFNAPQAFEQLVTTPRAQRFTEWGVLNDPDCHANPNGGMDVCADPNAT